MAETKTSVIHCPDSNFQLMSGFFDAKFTESFGVNIGLGKYFSLPYLGLCSCAVICYYRIDSLLRVLSQKVTFFGCHRRFLATRANVDGCFIVTLSILVYKDFRSFKIVA